MKLPSKLKVLVDSMAIAALRTYICNRIGLKPPRKLEDWPKFEERVKEFIDKIERMDTRMWEYLTEDEKAKARKLAQKYPEYIAYINADNILKWLAQDVPIAYGILVGHPKGRQWLELTLSRFIQNLMGLELEVEVADEEQAAAES